MGPRYTEHDIDPLVLEGSDQDVGTGAHRGSSVGFWMKKPSGVSGGHQAHTPFGGVCATGYEDGLLHPALSMRDAGRRVKGQSDGRRKTEGTDVPASPSPTKQPAGHCKQNSFPSGSCMTIQYSPRSSAARR